LKSLPKRHLRNPLRPAGNIHLKDVKNSRTLTEVEGLIRAVLDSILQITEVIGTEETGLGLTTTGLMGEGPQTRQMIGGSTILDPLTISLNTRAEGLLLSLIAIMMTIDHVEGAIMKKEDLPMAEVATMITGLLVEAGHRTRAGTGTMEVIEDLITETEKSTTMDVVDPAASLRKGDLKKEERSPRKGVAVGSDN
jgi:hypothetical protein